MQADLENRKGVSPKVDASPVLPSATELPALRISEIYASIQGEGLLTGRPSVFVRTSGCNLRCGFCDTPFASWSPEGETMSLDAILKRCEEYSETNIVLTGGEPMLFPQMAELTRRLSESGRHITIETAGTLYQDVHCDLMSISPKLSNSNPQHASERWKRAHEERRLRMDVVAQLIAAHEYQLKFVIGTPSDAHEALDFVATLESSQSIAVDRRRVLMMPEGVDCSRILDCETWLLPWCQDHGVEYSTRSHILWFGNRRGT